MRYPLYDQASRAALVASGRQQLVEESCVVIPDLLATGVASAMALEAVPSNENPFATIEEAIEDIRQGRMVVVVDDADRENEGDLTIAAQFATPEAVNFMATHGRGLICLALTA